MIKIFSIKEIIQASTDILNSQNLEKTNTKNISDGKKKIIPNSDYENIIDEKMLSSKPLVLKKEINKSEDIPPSVEKIISQAEEKQFKILSKKSKIINNLDYQKIVDELYKLFNKKIKKNTLKLIIDLRNNIVSLDEKIISLKEKEQKITINNKLLGQDIKNLINTQNSLQHDLKEKDLDLNQIKIKLIGSNDKIIKLKDNNELINFDLQLSHNKNSKLNNTNNELRDNINELKIKITNDQSKLNQLENDKNDLNLKLKGYKNQNIKLENDNKNLEQDNNELKIKIEKFQDKLEYFEKINSELKIKLEKNINLNNIYKKSNNELNLKLNELDELKTYKYKYLEYKQKNTDLENMLAKIKVDEDKNLQNLNVVNELEDKIKFYQEENVRIGSELSETKKKSEILKDEIDKYENQRSELITQINSVNDVIKDSNILTNVFENKIEPKIGVIDPQNNQNKPESNLNEQVKAIFSKKI